MWSGAAGGTPGYKTLSHRRKTLLCKDRPLRRSANRLSRPSERQDALRPDVWPAESSGSGTLAAAVLFPGGDGPVCGAKGRLRPSAAPETMPSALRGTAVRSAQARALPEAPGRGKKHPPSEGLGGRFFARCPEKADGRSAALSYMRAAPAAVFSQGQGLRRTPFQVQEGAACPLWARPRRKRPRRKGRSKRRALGDRKSPLCARQGGFPCRAQRGRINVSGS